MSNGMSISPSIEILTTRKPFVSPDLAIRVISSAPYFSIRRKDFAVRLVSGGSLRGDTYLADHRAEGYSQGVDDLPANIELQPISSESQFDQVISEAQELQEPVVFVWKASWCRKCIYLKPKLEKLAAEYYPRIRFYSIDVNNVSHKLVVRAGVTKMPTIQVWKDGEKQAEVIAGNKPHLVVNEIREIIENEDAL